MISCKQIIGDYDNEANEKQDVCLIKTFTVETMNCVMKKRIDFL